MRSSAYYLLLAGLTASLLAACSSRPRYSPSQKDSESSSKVSSGSVGVTSSASAQQATPSQPIARDFGPQEPEHTLKSNESLWFISNIYFQNPERYTEILEYNGIKNLKSVKVGQKFKIPEPFHSPEDPGFNERYQRLHKKRNERLALKKMKSNSELEVSLRVPAQSKNKDSAKAIDTGKTKTDPKSLNTSTSATPQHLPEIKKTEPKK